MPRIDSLTADRVAPPVRIVPPVTPVHPSGATANGAEHANTGGDGGEQARREHMASASDYARVQARIADILSQMGANISDRQVAREQAQSQIEALRPEPTVVIPLPPASKDQIEHAIQVARAMAQEAALTRAAQANVGTGTVDQLLAMPA
ncbi:MAG: hypothetical protein KDE67_12735 [Sphingobium sp.]|nr:hypothetical protein [Sphingobium sp.]